MKTFFSLRTLLAIMISLPFAFVGNPIYAQIHTDNETAVPSYSNHLYQMIEAKKSTEAFEPVSPFTIASEKKQYKKHDPYVSNALYLQLNKNMLDDLHKKHTSNITLEVPVTNGHNFELELTRVDITTDDYALQINKGERQPHKPSGVFYRGIIKNDSNSLVAVSVYKNHIRGLITDDTGNYVLGKLKDNEDAYILYKDKDLKIDLNFSCEIPGDDLPQSNSYKSSTVGAQKTTLNGVVEVYVEADYAMYQAQGSSVANVENYITALFHEVATIYANENIPISLNTSSVWTGTDPYTSLSASQTLSTFGNDNPTFPGNLAHFISGKYSKIGVAWKDQLCKNSPYAVSSGMGITVTPFPTYSWDVYVFAHEMGHSMGSPHTHACAWNGDNTQIDNCSGFEYPCYDPSIPRPVNAGTIMSYCYSNINFNMGFGPQPGDLIRDRYQNATCLDNSCQIIDSLALVALYQSTNGANWTNTWDLNQPVDTWYGVDIDPGGCVYRIRLQGNGLNGNIPQELGSMSSLQHVWLHKNQLNGSIPPELGNLTQLYSLWLDNNQLNGSIPAELGNITSLINLRLHSNQLSGNIPSELGNLDNLKYLRLQRNQLTGSIPGELGNLSALRQFLIFNNDLSGCYDDNLTALCSQLNPDFSTDALISNGNNFIGPWSSFCAGGPGNCSTLHCSIVDSLALVALYQSTNGANWTNTWNLNQPMNTWHGVSLNGQGCVRGLQLHNNGLNGNIPPELGNISGLRYLWLDRNQLSGSIPKELGNLENLVNLRLHKNQLSGDIPPELGNLSNLGYLRLHRNQLTGSIPVEFSQLNQLKQMLVFNNNLEGCYPYELTPLCVQLNPTYSTNTLISNGNNFDASWEDFCSTSAGVCCQDVDSLALIALYNSTGGTNWTNTWNLNQPMDTWHGVILSETGCVKELRLNSNGLVGTIPSEVGMLSGLTYLGLQFNQLSGNIPEEVGNLNNLTRLILNNNQLNGSIPRELGNLNSLIFLRLYNNNLTGCYDSNLIGLCTQLGPNGTNNNVSNGNNLDASWESFCNAGAGGCLDKIATSDNPTGLSIHPNPFNSMTNIELTLSEDTHVSLDILNPIGQVVKQLIRNEQMIEGKHQLSFEASHLPAGIYYCTLTAGTMRQTQKIVIYK